MAAIVFLLQKNWFLKTIYWYVKEIVQLQLICMMTEHFFFEKEGRGLEQYNYCAWNIRMIPWQSNQQLFI